MSKGPVTAATPESPLPPRCGNHSERHQSREQAKRAESHETSPPLEVPTLASRRRCQRSVFEPHPTGPAECCDSCSHVTASVSRPAKTAHRIVQKGRAEDVLRSTASAGHPGFSTMLIV